MSDVLQLTPASGKLQQELWISFVSLVRSHVAMLSIAQPAAEWKIEASSETCVDVGVSGRILRVSAPYGGVAGRLEFRAPDKEESAFMIFTDEGRVLLINPVNTGKDLTSMEMDVEAAVESLLRKVQA